MKFKHFYRLAKPRIVGMVIITTAFGYVLGAQYSFSWGIFLLLLLGIVCTASGAAMLNNFLEREIDGRMKRTRNRLLPSGEVQASNALNGGVFFVLAGTVILSVSVNLLCAFMALLSAFIYVLIYTPLKQRTWLNTSIGAIPGALPISCGWVAARQEMGIEGWMLFALLFIWQHPHFFAISWIYRKDYEVAGFKMLSVIDPSGKRLFRQLLVFSTLLLVISFLPYLQTNIGLFYVFGAFLLGIWMMSASIYFYVFNTEKAAKRLWQNSIFYLPALLGCAAIDLLLI